MLTPVGSLLVVNAPTLEISTGLASPAYASVKVETLNPLYPPLQDWMVMAFRDASRGPAPTPPPSLHRLAFESDNFRKRSMLLGL